MLNWLKNKIKSLIDTIKNWSGWSTAGSIFIARMEVVSGFILATLNGINWDSLISLDFSKGINTPVAIAGGLLVVKGIVTELTRRHGATDL